MKRPSFQFYPSDWLRDTALRTCSIEARGLWMDMLCYMHEGNPYGHLKVNMKVILPANLASMVGLTLETTERCLNELLDAGVVQKMDDGTMFSKRMVRDEDLRNKRAEGGKLGGNPQLKGRLTSKDKQIPTPSSSSSSIKKINKKNPERERQEELFKSAGVQNMWKVLVDECGRTALENSVNPLLFALAVEEYSGKFLGMGQEIKSCVFYHKSKGKKKLLVTAVRNWFKNRVRFNKDTDLKKMTAEKDSVHTAESLRSNKAHDPLPLPPVPGVPGANLGQSVKELTKKMGWN